MNADLQKGRKPERLITDLQCGWEGLNPECLTAEWTGMNPNWIATKGQGENTKRLNHRLRAGVANTDGTSRAPVVPRCARPGLCRPGPLGRFSLPVEAPHAGPDPPQRIYALQARNRAR